MLYDDITYESILSRMIGRVESWARGRGMNLDTREGSLIRTALSPAAVEMNLMYIELDEVLNESFADTASREFLIRRCAERGISVEQATKAIRRGEFNMDVAVGSRFSLNHLNYVAVERISKGVFKLECETPGNVGNYESGRLIPIDYIQGLETAVLTEIIIPGDDEETTEHLRQRYFDSLSSQAFGGNIADYREKVNKLPGVGGCKVYPVWNGGGTVKVVFLNSMFRQPSETQVSDVQTAIDPVGNQGEGVGLAPIGHVVTVKGVTGTIIDIQTHITFQTGWDWEAVKPHAENAIDQYFYELSVEWEKSDVTVVRISQIETRLLGLNGVIDVHGTSLYGTAQNLMLGPDSIPQRGYVTNV